MKKNQNFKKRVNLCFLHRKGIFMRQNLTCGLILSRLSREKCFFLHSLLQNLEGKKKRAYLCPKNKNVIRIYGKGFNYIK